MEIYLLRHGIAVDRGTPGYPNDDRPLTDEGISKMKKGAKGIAHLVPDFDVILTSPLSRARETAEITARAAGCEDRIEIADELLPEASTKTMFNRAAACDGAHRILIVGHEPNLSLFASFLLGGTASFMDFKKGGLCRIDLPRLKPPANGILTWHMPPKALRAFASKKKETDDL